MQQTVRQIIKEELDKFLSKNLIREGYRMPQYDLSEIGSVSFETYFDEDEYAEWLQENGLENSQEALIQYYKEELTYDFELFDSEDYHHIDYWSGAFLDDVEDYFGEKGAEMVLQQCMQKGKGSFETIELFDDIDVDVNNPYELDAAAMRIIKHGEYYKGCRGFILHNGVVIYTPYEHNECSSIKGVQGTVHFIDLGNVRVMGHSMDIGQKPTPQQEEVIEQMLEEYYGEEMYLDLDGGRQGQCGVRYAEANPSKIMADIDRYYEEGMKPIGDDW